MSFNDSVNIEVDVDLVSNKKISNRKIFKAVPPVIVSNEMKATIFREEKNERTKNPAKYHLRQVGDVMMNLSLVVMSRDSEKACKQVIQVVLKTVI